MINHYAGPEWIHHSFRLKPVSGLTRLWCIVRSRREFGTRNDPQMTGHRQVKDISTDRNINENNLRKSVSSADEFLFSVPVVQIQAFSLSHVRRLIYSGIPLPDGGQRGWFGRRHCRRPSPGRRSPDAGDRASSCLRAEMCSTCARRSCS